MSIRKYPRGLGAILTLVVMSSLAGCGTGGSEGNGAAAGEVDSAARALLPGEIRDRNTLEVGVRNDITPNSFENANGEIVGWEYELVTAAIHRLGLTANEQVISFDAIIPGLLGNRYEMAFGNMGATLERQEQVDFVSVYSAKHGIGVAKGSDLDIKGVADLCGLTVAVVRGSLEYDTVVDATEQCEDGEQIDIKTLQTTDQAVLAVESQRVDAFVVGSIVASYLAGLEDADFEVTAEYGEGLPIVVAFRTGSTALEEAFKAAMDSLIADGTYAEILKRWSMPRSSGIKEAKVNPAVS